MNNNIAVLLDMDGVLLHLDHRMGTVRHEIASIYRLYGLNRYFRPVLEQIEQAGEALAARGISSADVQRRALDVLDRAEHLGASGAVPRPGALEVLDGLEDLTLGLVSNTGPAGVRRALEKTGIDSARFKALICRGDAPRPKPAADPLIRAIEIISAGGRKPTAVLFVGDGPGDIVAAHRAKEFYLARQGPEIISVAITGGLYSSEALAQCHPEHTIDDPRDIMKVLSDISPDTPSGVCMP